MKNVFNLNIETLLLGNRPDDTTKYYGKFKIITGAAWNSDLDNENSNAYQTLVASLTTQV